jgi:hypothetical protein
MVAPVPRVKGRPLVESLYDDRHDCGRRAIASTWLTRRIESSDAQGKRIVFVQIARALSAAPKHVTDGTRIVGADGQAEDYIWTTDLNQRATPPADRRATRDKPAARMR